MTTQSLTKYTCDGCGASVVTKSAPEGWIRMCSTSSADKHITRAPVQIRVVGSHSVTVEADFYWCEPDCLVLWLASKAEVRRSKRGLR